MHYLYTQNLYLLITFNLECFKYNDIKYTCMFIPKNKFKYYMNHVYIMW